MTVKKGPVIYRAFFITSDQQLITGLDNELSRRFLKLNKLAGESLKFVLRAGFQSEIANRGA